MTAKDLVAALRHNRPQRRWAHNRNETAVAYWDDDLQRWRVVGALGIDRRWYGGGDGLYVDGKPAFPQDSFAE